MAIIWLCKNNSLVECLLLTNSLEIELLTGIRVRQSKHILHSTILSLKLKQGVSADKPLCVFYIVVKPYKDYESELAFREKKISQLTANSRIHLRKEKQYMTRYINISKVTQHPLIILIMSVYCKNKIEVAFCMIKGYCYKQSLLTCITGSHTWPVERLQFN